MTSSPDATRAQALKALWRATFWVAFPFGILSFVLPIYGKELGASALEIGRLFSAMALMPVIIRPLLGRALDRWGRRPFLLMGLLGYASSMLIFCLSNTVATLTLARFVQGLGQAFLWLSAYTIVADLASESGRGHDFGSIDEATNRGAIIGTMGGFAIIMFLDAYGIPWERIWFLLFAAYALPAVLALVLAWRGVYETKPQVTLKPVESKPISGQLLVLMGIVFVTGASSAMVWPLLMVFLQDILGADVMQLTWAYLPAAVASAFLPSRMGRIADRVGRKLPMIVGLLVGGLASALMPHLQSVFLLAALWAVESVGYTASVPAERALVADIAGEDTRGTSYGLYTFSYFLGSLVGPLAGGWLYDNIGHATPFYLNTAVLLLGALLVAALLRETRPNLQKAQTELK